MNIINLFKHKNILPFIGVIFFGIYPVLALYAHNIDQLVLRQLFFPLFIGLILAVLTYLFLLIIIKKHISTSISAIVFLICFWNYDLLFNLFSNLFGLKHWHLIPLVIFIYLHLVYFISRAKQLKTLLNINYVLIIPISILVLINLINIVPSEINKVSTSKIGQDKSIGLDKYNNVEYLPDVYLIILDEYASLSTIRDEWGYDNSSFRNYLKGKGFYVMEKSEHMYIGTLWNMASLLDLDYLTEPVEKDFWFDVHYEPNKIKNSEIYRDLEKYSENQLIQMIGNNLILNKFAGKGYTNIVLEGISQHYPSMSFNNADTCFSYQEHPELLNKTAFSDPFYLELFKKTIIAPFDFLLKFDQTYNINFIGTKHVVNFLKNNTNYFERPKFVYAHIVCPHNPYVFDRKGNYTDPIRDYPRKGKYVIPNNTLNKAYLDQYVYITNEVKEIVNNLVKGKPNDPILIIQSDHGPRPHELYLKDKLNVFSVFNAVYFPDADYSDLHDSISPVNTLRVMFNNYFGEKYIMLED